MLGRGCGYRFECFQALNIDPLGISMFSTNQGERVCELSGDAPRHVRIGRFARGNAYCHLRRTGMAQACNSVADGILLAAQDDAFGLPERIPNRIQFLDKLAKLEVAARRLVAFQLYSDKGIRHAESLQGHGRIHNPKFTKMCRIDAMHDSYWIYFWYVLLLTSLIFHGDEGFWGLTRISGLVGNYAADARFLPTSRLITTNPAQ